MVNLVFSQFSLFLFFLYRMDRHLLQTWPWYKINSEMWVYALWFPVFLQYTWEAVMFKHIEPSYWRSFSCHHQALEKNQQWLMYDQQREAYVQSVLSQLAQVKQQQQAKQEATPDGEYMRWWSQSSHLTLYGALIHRARMEKWWNAAWFRYHFFPHNIKRWQNRWEIMRKEIVKTSTAPRTV